MQTGAAAPRHRGWAAWGPSAPRGHPAPLGGLGSGSPAKRASAGTAGIAFSVLLALPPPWQGYRECFQTIAALLAPGQGRGCPAVPCTQTVILRWESAHWSDSNLMSFIQRVGPGLSWLGAGRGRMGLQQQEWQRQGHLPLGRGRGGWAAGVHAGRGRALQCGGRGGPAVLWPSGRAAGQRRAGC